MNINHLLRLLQWEHIKPWLSHLTAGAIGGFVTWFLGIRKLNAEIKQLRSATAKNEEELRQLQRKSKVDAILLKIKLGVAQLPPNTDPVITPDPGDDLDCFTEAKLRYEDEVKNRGISALIMRRHG